MELLLLYLYKGHHSK